MIISVAVIGFAVASGSLFLRVDEEAGPPGNRLVPTAAFDPRTSRLPIDMDARGAAPELEVRRTAIEVRDLLDIVNARGILVWKF
jgi:hypothetical protein